MSARRSARYMELGDRLRAKVNDLLKLPDDDKRALIVAASTYRSGADSINTVYMGSMATASLLSTMGGVYGKDGVDACAAAATTKQLDAALESCVNIIAYMQENPMRKCPCCGQVMTAVRA